MKDVIEQEFGIRLVEIKELNGYENKNYLIRTEKEAFIFKTYPFNTSNFELVEAENKALIFLQQSTELHTPRPIAFSDGSFTKNIELEGQKLTCRLLSFLDGEFMGDSVFTKQMASSLGHFLAHINLALFKFDNPVIRARKCEWDIQQVLFNRKYINEIPEVSKQNLVRYFMLQFEQKVVPISSELRMNYIHSDANEWNVLLNENEVTGLIDFGDMVYSPLINELATALTYICYDKESYFECTLPLVSAYHKIVPLENKEISIIYYLIAAKLCISVCQSAHAKKHDPENIYAASSEANAWKMLHKLLEINPIAFEDAIRKQIGFERKKKNLKSRS